MINESISKSLDLLLKFTNNTLFARGFEFKMWSLGCICEQMGENVGLLCVDLKRPPVTAMGLHFINQSLALIPFSEQLRMVIG